MTDFLLQIKNTGAERPQPIPSTPPNTTPLHSLHKCVEINTAQIGGFEIHVNGENDLRACYCALVVADILNILSQENAQILKYRLAAFIASCQTYEGGIFFIIFLFFGGFSCVPYGEAHGGYTYCAIAALVMLDRVEVVDLQSAIQWFVNRQLVQEGAFNGRINKLVDSCYNFWQGSLAELFDIALKGKANYRGYW